MLASPRHTLFRSALPVLAALAAGPAHAAVWNVLPDGTGDVPTIQDAVDAATGGDEILLGDGAFTGPGNRDISFGGKELTVRSASGEAAACVIDLASGVERAFLFTGADGPAAVVRDLTITGGTAGCIRTSGDPTLWNVTFLDYTGNAIHSQDGTPVLRNGTFRGGAGPAFRATYGGVTLSDCLFEGNTTVESGSLIELYRPSDAVLERCVFRDNVPDISEGHVVRTREGALTLTDCEIRDNALLAITVNGGATTLVDRCTVEANTGGLYLFGYGSGSPGACLVRDSAFRGHHGSSGIHVSKSTDLTVDGATVEDNRWGIRVDSHTTGRYLVVADSRSTGNEYSGLSGTYANVQLLDCEFRGNGQYGIDLSNWSTFPSNVTITGCLVTGNGTRGVRMDGIDGPNSRIERCTIASNGGAGTGGGLRITGASNFPVLNTILWGNCSPDDSDALVDADCAVQFDCCVVDPARVFSGGGVAFLQSVVADPMFCSPDGCDGLPSAAGSYRLDSASPALGAACGPIGALDAECGAISVESSTWTRIKARYR